MNQLSERGREGLIKLKDWVNSQSVDWILYVKPNYLTRLQVLARCIRILGTGEYDVLAQYFLNRLRNEYYDNE